MSNNNNSRNDLYQLELQKVDLMIGIWQEINRFSNRVLALHINHRDSVYQMAKNKHLRPTAPTLTTNSSRNSHHIFSNGHTTNPFSNLHSKRKQDHDTSSESESESEHDEEIEANTESKTSKNHNKNQAKKERKTTKGRCSGYNIYFGQRCKELQKSDPHLEFATISRNIGIEWKNLNKAEQQKWNEVAAKTTKQRQKEMERKKEKKRKFTAMNGNVSENMNEMVSNVRIEDKNGGNNLLNPFSVAPPHKKMRLDHIRNMATSNNLHIPMMSPGTLAMLNQKTPLPQTREMAKPALSLLSEALKKMPALQPAASLDLNK